MTATAGTYATLRRAGTLDVENRRVFLLTEIVADPNAVLAERRVVGSIPGIKGLLDAGARLVVGAHAGFVDGHPSDILDAAQRLAGRLDTDVVVPDEIAGDALRRVLTEHRTGQVILLANLDQLAPGSAAASHATNTLAGSCDAFVHDSLTAAAQSWAGDSLAFRVGLVAAGPRLADQYRALSRIKEHVGAGLTLILGDSLVLGHLSEIGDILTGMGAGDQLLVDTTTRPDAQTASKRSGALTRELARLLRKARARDVRVVVPVDYDVFDDDGQTRVRAAEAIRSGDELRAVGPATLAAFAQAVTGSCALAWLGTAAAPAVRTSDALVAAVARIEDSLVVLDDTAAQHLDATGRDTRFDSIHVFCADVPGVWQALTHEAIPSLAPLYDLEPASPAVTTDTNQP